MWSQSATLHPDDRPQIGSNSSSAAPGLHDSTLPWTVLDEPANYAQRIRSTGSSFRPPQLLLASEDRKAVPPATPLEKTIVESFERCFWRFAHLCDRCFFPRSRRALPHSGPAVATDLRAEASEPPVSACAISTRTGLRAIWAQHLEQTQLIEFPKIGKTDAVANPPAAKEEVVSIAGRRICAFIQAAGRAGFPRGCIWPDSVPDPTRH